MNAPILIRPEIELLLTALRYLQENLQRLPGDFLEYLGGEPPQEAEIDDLCARLAAAERLVLASS